MDDQSIPGLKDVILDDLRPQTPDPELRARRSWQARAQGGPFAVDPGMCDIWAGNTRDVAALTSASFLDLRESLKSVGQKIPVVARISLRDLERLEIVAGACRLTAIRQINEECQHGDRMQVLVDLRDLDDKAALMIVDAENRGRSDMSVLEKGRFYERAIESIYHTEKALAQALAINKSTVNRTLAITRLPREVLGLIKNPHGISAAQASDFMADWNTPELRDRLIDRIDELSTKGLTSAKAAWRKLTFTFFARLHANYS